MNRKLSLFFLALFFFDFAFAGSGAGNLTFHLELGTPEIAITNPDGSTAYYDGLATNLKAIFPIFTTKSFQTSVSGNFRYFDLENTTTANVKETAQMIGPGIGLDFKLYILHFGYGMQFMKARHQSIARISTSIEYDFSYSGYYIGVVKSFKQLGVGLFMTSSSGSIDASETGLSTDSDFEENTLWFTIKYDFGVNTGKFLKSLIN